MRSVFFVCVLAACTRAAPGTASPSMSGLRIVPQGMVGVALVGAERAPLETITAVDLQAQDRLAGEEALRVGRSTEGAPGIFFYGFDANRLVYFYGRTHWRCGGLGCWDYVAEKLYVVPRGGSAETLLGVDNQIALYEKGDVVTGGMTFAQVRAKLGAPARVETMQYVGSERWHYPARTILFLDGEVAGIEAPSP